MEVGNDTIITFIDSRTKCTYWVPTTETISAKDFTELFLEFYIRLHRFPDVIISDKDVRFTSEFWSMLMVTFKTKLEMSTAFHLQTDGQAEEANSIVEW